MEVVAAAPDHTQTTCDPISDDSSDINLVIYLKPPLSRARLKR